MRISHASAKPIGEMPAGAAEPVLSRIAYRLCSIAPILCLSFSHEVKSMPRRLPQLSALRAFEAAARHVSFTRAAEELCVTQGAVSHQVKALESDLGIKFFNRERQRLTITAAGQEYLAVVRDALDRIATGTERLVQRQSSGLLTVSTSPDFAAKWLIHRLGRFAEVHPEIDLRVSATMHHVDFAREDVDIAVRHGDRPLARTARNAFMLRTSVRCVQSHACAPTRPTR